MAAIDRLGAIVGIRFKDSSRIRFFSPGNDEFRVGQHIVTRTEDGVKVGEVVVAPQQLVATSLLNAVPVLIDIETVDEIHSVKNLLPRFQFPRLGETVGTKSGSGWVCAVDTRRNVVSIRIDSGNMVELNVDDLASREYQ